MDSAHRSDVASSVRRVSFALQLLAGPEPEGRKRSLAQSMAHVAGRIG